MFPSGGGPNLIQAVKHVRIMPCLNLQSVHTQDVDMAMTCCLYKLLDEGIMQPEEVIEPMMITMGLNMAIQTVVPQSAGGAGADADARDGSLSPSMVTEALSDGDEFRLAKLEIRYNHSDRGTLFAMQVGEIFGRNFRIDNLDAHITLFNMGEADAARGWCVPANINAPM